MITRDKIYVNGCVCLVLSLLTAWIYVNVQSIWSPLLILLYYFSMGLFLLGLIFYFLYLYLLIKGEKK